jgi:hypothetical protein
LIVAGRQVDPGPVGPAPVDQDTPAVPRMVLAARGAQCTPHELSPAVLPAPVDALPLVRPGLVLVRAPASVRLAPARVAQAV